MPEVQQGKPGSLQVLPRVRRRAATRRGSEAVFAEDASAGREGGRKPAPRSGSPCQPSSRSCSGTHRSSSSWPRSCVCCAEAPARCGCCRRSGFGWRDGRLPAVRPYQPTQQHVLRCVWLPAWRRRSPQGARLRAATGHRRGHGDHQVLTALRGRRHRSRHLHHPAGSRGPRPGCGSDTGGIFASDSYLSPKHALFRMKGVGKLTVQDQGSLNGVYRKLAPKVAVEPEPSDVFRIGQEIVKFLGVDRVPAALTRRRRATRRAEQGLHRAHRTRHRSRDHR